MVPSRERLHATSPTTRSPWNADGTVWGVADGTVWGVNSAGNIYRYTGDQESGHWKQISGGLKAISAGSRTSVWGANAGGNIYRYTNNDASPWVQIPGALTDIGAGVDGTVWGVNSAGNIYRYTGDLPG
ncbi:tectonin domain-containing protein [Streptomyces lydicus]|uniref:tectonin domain-containing protein n=1 Tax=Streptomyces lydicus TaxID=47763 RepID=UPI0031F8CDE0